MLKKLENLENKHSGSMTAIICGILLFTSGILPFEETGELIGSSVIGGISLFFGAIAYRLAKKRKLGTVNFFLVAIEIICISIAVLIVAMTSKEFMQQNSIAVLICASVTISYLRMVTAK
tara:strand:+ start:640 stop:999 length:360 start_codon:yes stop_codon:yes gene_type:complete